MIHKIRIMTIKSFDRQFQSRLEKLMFQVIFYAQITIMWACSRITKWVVKYTVHKQVMMVYCCSMWKIIVKSKSSHLSYNCLCNIMECYLGHNSNVNMQLNMLLCYSYYDTWGPCCSLWYLYCASWFFYYISYDLSVINYDQCILQFCLAFIVCALWTCLHAKLCNF